MKVRTLRTLDGPNVFNHRPVLLMELDLEDLAATDTAAVPDFTARLLDRLPGLVEHTCSRGRRGGFVERLREGTYFGHVVEHVALELSDHAGIPVTYGKTVSTEHPSVYRVAVAYRSPAGMASLLRTAVALVDALRHGDGFALDEAIENARREAERTALGPSTAAIVQAAEMRGIPVVRLNEGSLVQLGYGKHRKHILASLGGNTSAVAVEIAGDKHQTKSMLERAFLPVPDGRVVASEDDAVEAWEELGVPVAVKPLDGNQGRGVSLGVQSEAGVREAFRCAVSISDDVIVEEFFEGRDFRVLVVGGRMVAASERTPAHVVGDGKSSIDALIAIENRDPRRGDGHDKPLTRLELDDESRVHLARQGLAPSDVPDPGRRVWLRATANLSTGGTAVDVTDRVHAGVRQACERAARVVGLDICGVDLITHDIAAPFERGRGGIVELNAAPGLRMHHHPSEGTPRDTGAAIIDTLFPSGTPSRIPIVSITGTNGKTTVARMIGHTLGTTGLTVGMTTTDGVCIGRDRVANGDMTGPRSARAVLCDPAVDVAVLETARGGIMRGGLGYDWSDVGVITNIQLDHIGQDGIHDLDDIVWVKSLVAERVRENGTLVLNADDAEVSRLPELARIARLKRAIVYFSVFPRQVLVLRHLAAGGRALFLENGQIVEAHGTTRHGIVDVEEIPATMGGAAQFNIANALAAAAAARAMGVTREHVRKALTEFDADNDNPGRANLYRVRDGYLVLDYGHNPAAFEAIGRMAANWQDRRVTGVVTVPGDRATELIQSAGRAAARAFDRLIIREDNDRRGRAVGEVAALLRDAVREECDDCATEIILDEVPAVHAAISAMEPDEVVVAFYDDWPAMQTLLREFDAQPARRLCPVGTPVRRRVR